MEALPKTRRVRKKRLFSLILNQMEFYFSNASLTRDKFLQAYLEKDKYVPVSVFLTFNKIKELTADVGDVVRALRKSQFLQLSPDGSGVARRSPFVLKEDAERCTIYVENIPRGFGAGALRRTFSAFGTIDYISVPVNRTTGQHRGFGFVEFRTPNMAHNALQAFGALGRRMPSEHYPEYFSPPPPPAEHALLSAPSDAETDEFGGDVTDDVIAVTSDQPPPPAGAETRPGKRKMSTDSSSRDAPLKVTRFAETPESSELAASSHPTMSLPTAGSATPAYTDNSNLSEWRIDGASRAASLQTDDTDVSADCGGQQQQQRRRTRRGRKPCVTGTEDTALLALRIMPLSEWSRYREQYRTLQKENMGAAKLMLREERRRRLEEEKPYAPVSGSGSGGGSEPQSLPSTVVKFTPVREANTPDKQLIAELKARHGALYVELPAEDTQLAYMRFPSAETAAAATAAEVGLVDAHVLHGSEEAAYWRRLVEERRRTRQSRVRSTERGRDRLLRRLCAASETSAGRREAAC